MYQTNDIKKLEKELIEAQSRVKNYGYEEWAVEWMESVEKELQKLTDETPEPIKNWPRYAKEELAMHLGIPILRFIKHSRMAILVAFFALGCVFMPQVTIGADIPSEMAINAILGEARGEGYIGMYAVACAIRNRGTLKGVYGANANISDVSGEIFQQASKAWWESEEGKDITHGADHWENVNAFGVPYWAKGRKPTAVIGHHKFYRVSK